MADLTYTATGKIDVANRKLKLDIFLPDEKTDNPYIFKRFFDLSKISIFKKQTNAVFCLFKLTKDNGDPLFEQSKKYPLEIDLDDLDNYRSVSYNEFDINLSDTLFILFHDTGKLNISDLDELHQNIEAIYTKVHESGSFNYIKDLKAKPRVLGMSIITK